MPQSQVTDEATCMAARKCVPTSDQAMETRKMPKPQINGSYGSQESAKKVPGQAMAARKMP